MAKPRALPPINELACISEITKRSLFSKCPRKLLKRLREDGFNVDDMSCIEAIQNTGITEAIVEADKGHAELLCRLFSGPLNPANIHINETNNTLNINYADEDKQIADIFRNALPHSESAGVGE